LKNNKNIFRYGDWGLGIGDWGLGVGAQTPNPQSPIPNPQSPIPIIQRIQLNINKIQFLELNIIIYHIEIKIIFEFFIYNNLN